MQLEPVTDGLEFPEGPVAMRDGSVLVVEIKRGTLTRVLPNGEKQVVAELGGGPNGAAIGPDGAVYVCNNGGFAWLDIGEGRWAPHGTPDDYRTGSIQRVDLATGAVTTLYESCDGIALRGPNDIVFDRDGGFWFTDLGKTDNDRMDIGHLLYATPDGKSITRVRDNLMTPNGVGLSPDGKTLYVAETRTSRLWAFDVEGPGVIGAPVHRYVPQKVLGPLPGYQMFDSLAVEADGRICVATLVSGAITVFEPGGAWEQVACPEPVITNICFGGDDMRTAWITASSTGMLYKCCWPRPGLRLEYNA